VLVIGGSQQGRQSIDALESAAEHEVVGVLDSRFSVGTDVVGYPVVGPPEELPSCARSTGAHGFLVAVGDNFTRGALFAAARVACPDLEPMSAVHSRALISPSAGVGPGVTVLAGAVVSNGCQVGAGALLGINSSLDHDGDLGAFASLGPGATTGGCVSIGSFTAVGLGANVIHGMTIGDHTVIGAGALVLEDVPASVVAFGAPARVVRRRDDEEPYL
jgi:sugar O-acyltransferase (sialic acid O-acetyltransferase NeuD family)